MATISTNTTLDATTRTAAEAYTIQQGAVFTIDTHTRYHAGVSTLAGAAGMGSLTMTAATGGELFIDGTKVKMVSYTGGSGNVPAYNASIVQGGVTGLFLSCQATLGAVPTAPGAAMPASGFILFKTVSGGSFTAGAFTSGITATVTGSQQAGFLEIVGVDTAGATIGRAQKFKTRMQWFYPTDTAGALITTSGARHQQIQLPNFGGANRFYPGIWIETGVGTNTYEFYPAVLAGTGTPWVTTALGSDVRSKFVQCLAGGIIRIGGDGTNSIGDLPVAGCKVRIPNILVGSCATTPTAADTVPHATLASRYDFTTTNAGVLDIEGMIGHWYINLGQAYAVKLWNVHLFDQFSIAENATALDIKECGNGNYIVAQDAAALVLTSNFAGGTIVDCKFGRSGTIAASDYGINVQYCNNITFTRTHFQNRTFRTNAGAHPFYAAYCDGLTFNDCVVVGASVYFATCTNTTLTSLLYADSYNTTSSATTPPAAVIQLVAGTLNTLINGFNWFTSVANVHPDTAILYLSAAFKVKVRNIGTYASPISAGSTNAMLYFCNDAGNSNTIEFKRVYFNLIATTFYNAVNSTKGVLIQNCTGNMTSPKNLVSAALNQDVRNSEFLAYAPGATASIYGSHFYNQYTSATAGRLGIIPSEPTTETASYITTNFTASATGVSGFNSSNGLALINSGDYAIFEFPYIIKGIDSFQNVAPTVTTATNLLTEYQIDTGAGWNGTWKTFNATNLSSEVIDEVAGFKFKIKVTASATNAANILTVLYCLTSANAAAQAILYPLDIINFTVTDLIPGSDVVVLSAGTTTVLTEINETVGSSWTYTYEEPHTIDIGINKAGYVPLYIRDYELGSTNGSFPVSQVPDRNYK